MKREKMKVGAVERQKKRGESQTKKLPKKLDARFVQQKRRTEEGEQRRHLVLRHRANHSLVSFIPRKLWVLLVGEIQSETCKQLHRNESVYGLLAVHGDMEIWNEGVVAPMNRHFLTLRAVRHLSLWTLTLKEPDGFQPSQTNSSTSRTLRTRW